MKTSLQCSNYELQDTLLTTIESISQLKDVEGITLHVSQLLLYFIMIPTSKLSLIAVDTFISMAKYHNIATNLIYSQNKKEMCETIAELCAINQALTGMTLSSSLEKISLALGFFGSKDMAVQDCRHFLPFFVAIAVKMPEVKKLINEMVSFMDVDLSNIFVGLYGNIFVHVFLNESDEVCMKALGYVEKHTVHSGSILRKRNFQVCSIYSIIVTFIVLF